MGSAPSQPQGGDYYGDQAHFQSTRSLRSNATRNSTKQPPDTRSTVLRVEKTQKDLRDREEKELNQQNGFTPFTPRGTIGYSFQATSNRAGNHAPPKSTALSNKRKAGSKKGDKGRGLGSRAGVSFNSKNVYISDDDVDLWNSEEGSSSVHRLSVRLSVSLCE